MTCIFRRDGPMAALLLLVPIAGSAVRFAAPGGFSETILRRDPPTR